MVERRYTGVEAHGPGWRGIYKIDGVRHRTRVYPTPKEAFDARSDAVVAQRRGEHVDRRRSGMTVDQWFEVWHPTRRIRAVTADHDAGRWANHVSPYLGRYRLDAVTPHLVDKWLKWLADNGRSLASQRKAYVLVKTALGVRGAIADRRIAVNPCDAVRPPRVHAVERSQMTREAFEAIVAGIPEGQDRTVALAAAYAGLRWSEIAGLRRCDFNPLRETLTVAQGLVAVRGQGNVVNAPKSGKTRTIPLQPRLLAALNEQAVGLNPHDLMFTNAAGRALSNSNYRNRVWLPAVQAANVGEWRVHDCRHAFASWLLEGGVDLGQVKAMMGHASITTTEGYIHTNEDKMREGLLRALG